MVSDGVLDALSRSLGSRAVRNEPIGPRTTYRVGGCAALWVEVQSTDDLQAVHEALAAVSEPVPVLALGKGSNLLVSDAGFRGLVVGMGEGYAWVEITGTTARAGGATGYPVLARRTAAAGLRGLEWAVGVPGSVGGALRMNAGGHGSQTAEVLTDFSVFDLWTGHSNVLGVSDLGAGYRRSALRDGQVVEWASFELRPGDAAEAQEAIAEIVRWRRANQPGGSNAGSVFTNPPGDAAGRLVEAAGLKGMRMGSAHVSDKHANFIQADDGGSADDVRRLVIQVADEVQSRTGVRLVPELRMVGFEDPVTGDSAIPSPSSRGRE